MEEDYNDIMKMSNEERMRASYEYRLRKEDFIPGIGLYKHHKRSINEMLRNHLVGNEDYAANAWARDSLLAIYNLAIIAAGIGAVTGLVSLLSK